MCKLASVFFLLLALAGCAAQQPLLKNTSSGHPEGVFANSVLSDIQNKLIGACSQIGAQIYEATPNQVVCGKTMQGGQALLAQMLVGNSYSTTPEQKIRFVAYQNGPNVIVTAYQWIESQMAFGQVRREELNGNNQNNDIQRVLWGLGAS